MGNEVMDLQELASYLQRDAREVQKLANRGYLPGKKISGEWRFHQSEINNWVESQMHAYTEQELSRLEVGVTPKGQSEQVLVSAMLSEATTSIPLQARTRTSLLKELVHLAEQSWEVYDPKAILKAIRQREELESTALPGGVAIPHPHRPLAAALGDNIISFARTATGIPFGGNYGGETDLFFLVLCRDHRTHLAVLARLSRMFLRNEFLNELRQTESSKELLALIETTEADLI